MTQLTSDPQKFNPFGVDFVGLARELDRLLHEQGIDKIATILQSDRLNGVAIGNSFAFVGDDGFVGKLVCYFYDKKQVGITKQGDIYKPVFATFIRQMQFIDEIELLPKLNFKNPVVLGRLAKAIIDGLQSKNLL